MTATETAKRIVDQFLPKSPTYLSGDIETGQFMTIQEAITQALERRDQMIEKMERCLEFYGDEDNWQEPDQWVPYWTLWDDGDCIDGTKARETLDEIRRVKND